MFSTSMELFKMQQKELHRQAEAVRLARFLKRPKRHHPSQKAHNGFPLQRLPQKS